MAHESVSSDRGLGLGVLLGLLALVAAGGMFAFAYPNAVMHDTLSEAAYAANQAGAAWSFAAAMVFGTLSVVAVQWFWD